MSATQDRREGGTAPGPFTKTELPRVVRCGRLSCSTDVTAGSVVEMTCFVLGKVGI